MIIYLFEVIKTFDFIEIVKIILFLYWKLITVKLRFTFLNSKLTITN